MPSTEKTQHLGLNKWIGSDRPKRADLVADNDKIDAAFIKIDSLIGINLNPGFRSGYPILQNQNSTLTWIDNGTISAPLPSQTCPKILVMTYTGANNYINVGKRINEVKSSKYSFGAWIKKDAAELVSGLGKRIMFFNSSGSTLVDITINIAYVNLVAGYTTNGINGEASYTLTVQQELNGFVYVSVSVTNLPNGISYFIDYWQPKTSQVSTGVSGTVTIMDWVILDKESISSSTTYSDTPLFSPDTTVNTWENKKVIFMGDSITANSSGWVSYFNTTMKTVAPVNVAVNGATWKDKVGTVYDGNPVFNGADANVNNVLGNQVQKILDNNYDAPDIIIIAAGTNDTVDITDLETQFTSAGSYIPLGSIDRKTFAGAIRYCVETLLTEYPNAQIFISLPIQGTESLRAYSVIKQKGDIIRSIANRLSIPVIEAGPECGIYGAWETDGVNGKYLSDGLHPNETGSQQLGKYIARKIANWFIV